MKILPIKIKLNEKTQQIFDLHLAMTLESRGLEHKINSLKAEIERGTKRVNYLHSEFWHHIKSHIGSNDALQILEVTDSEISVSPSTHSMREQHRKNVIDSFSKLLGE